MNRFQVCREQCNMSQKQVALEIGVSCPTVSQWENEIKNPSGKNLIKLAELFGVSVDYLIGKSENSINGCQFEFNQDEIKLINMYREMSTQGQEYIRQQMYIAASIYKKRIDISNVENKIS